MNMQQFLALKAGDEIENALSGSAGKVVKTGVLGVTVSWGGNAMEFFYPVHSTAWYHWNVPSSPLPPASRASVL